MPFLDSNIVLFAAVLVSIFTMQTIFSIIIGLSQGILPKYIEFFIPIKKPILRKKIGQVDLTLGLIPVSCSTSFLHETKKLTSTVNRVLALTYFIVGTLFFAVGYFMILGNPDYSFGELLNSIKNIFIFKEKYSQSLLYQFLNSSTGARVSTAYTWIGFTSLSQLFTRSVLESAESGHVIKSILAFLITGLSLTLAILIIIKIPLLTILSFCLWSILFGLVAFFVLSLLLKLLPNSLEEEE